MSDNARSGACLGEEDDEFQTFSTRAREEEYNQLNATGISEDVLINSDVIFDTSQLDKYQVEDEENLIGSFTARSNMTQATPRTSRLYEKKVFTQHVVPLRDPIEHHQIISRASECIKNLKTAVNSPINTTNTQEESNNALTALKLMDNLDYSSQYEIYQSPYEQKLSKISHLKTKLTEKASPRYMEPKKQITPPKETFSPQLNSKSAKSSPRYLDFMKSPKKPEKTARQIVQEKKDLELSKRMPNTKTSPSKTVTSPRNLTSPRSRSNSFKSDPVPVPTLPRKNSTGKRPNLVRKPKRADVDNVFEVSDMSEGLEENLLDESIEESVLYDHDDNEFTNIETTLSELDEIGLESPPETLFINPLHVENFQSHEEEEIGSGEENNSGELVEEGENQSEPLDEDITGTSRAAEEPSEENDEFEVSNDDNDEPTTNNEEITSPISEPPEEPPSEVLEENLQETVQILEDQVEEANTSSVSKQSEHETHDDEFEQVEEEEMQEELLEETKSIPEESYDHNVEASQEMQTVFHEEVESDEFNEEIAQEAIVQPEETLIEEQEVPPTEEKSLTCETELVQPESETEQSSENVNTVNVDNTEIEAVIEEPKVEEPAKVIEVAEEPKIVSVSTEPQKPKKNKKNKNKNKKNKKKN